MKQYLPSDPLNNVTIWIYINLNYMMSQPLVVARSLHEKNKIIL